MLDNFTERCYNNLVKQKQISVYGSPNALYKLLYKDRSKTKTNFRKQEIVRLVLLALLTPIVAVLAYFGGFIKIGGLASISLTLIPVVLGSAMLGPVAGAWLGGVSSAIFFATVDAVFWFGLSIPGTIITVMVKGILSGYLAGLTYKLLEKRNRYVAVIAAAVVCPCASTALKIS